MSKAIVKPITEEITAPTIRSSIRSLTRARRLPFSGAQKIQAFIGSGKTDFKDFGTYDVFRDKRIVVHPTLEILHRRVERQDSTARIGLQTADKQK